MSDHVDGWWHRIGFVLVRQISHVPRIQVSDVIYVLLARERRQRVSQGVEAFPDVWVHVNVDPAHFPKHVESPGTSAAALCVQEEEGRREMKQRINNLYCLLVTMQIWSEVKISQKKNLPADGGPVVLEHTSYVPSGTMPVKTQKPVKLRNWWIIQVINLPKN